MGFKVGAFCKVWTVEPVSDINTKLRISINRKDKNTGKYEQEFGGYVNCFGAVAAKRASSLKEGDRIKLTEVDVTTKYDKAKNVTYTNYKVFAFEKEDEVNNSKSAEASSGGNNDPQLTEDQMEENKLPF